MQDWMRKHRRLIMAFILIFICIPFVFMFGMPSNNSSNRPSLEEGVVATVGGVPIMESEFRHALDSMAGTRRGQNGETPSYQELDKDGSVQRVMENMVDAALVKLQEQQRNFTVDESVLSEQMKKWEMFTDEQGNFNHAAWNEWVGSVSTWDEIYADVNSSLARKIYLDTVMAPGNRVLAKKVDEEIRDNHTKMRVKYVKIEPAITPTEEELRAEYDKNPDRYRLPKKVNAEFIAFSLIPPMPEIAMELVERARKGEDFAALAKEYSTLTSPEGGELGWRTETGPLASQMQALFALKPGEVSEPVASSNGYVIYKNEEERIKEDTQEREVSGRQIVLAAELDATVRAEIEKKADDIAARLQAGENVETIGTELGLEVKQTGFFDRSSEHIENVDDGDVMQFRSQVPAQEDTPWKPLKAKNNIYLARVMETREGDLEPFEDVQEKVKNSVIEERKRTEEYKTIVAGYTDRLQKELTKLEDVNTIFPELNATISETKEPFTLKDSLFQSGLYLQPKDIYDALRDKAAGSVGGPLNGFLGETFFVELIERIDPKEEDLADVEGEREEIEKRIKQTNSYEMLADYTKDLRERMLASVAYEQNTEVMDRILGRNLPETSTEGETEGELPTPAEGEIATATEGELSTPAEGEIAAATEAESSTSIEGEAAVSLEKEGMSEEEVAKPPVGEESAPESDEAAETLDSETDAASTKPAGIIEEEAAAETPVQ